MRRMPISYHRHTPRTTTSTPRHCRGCSPPSPASPDQAAPSFDQAATTAQRRELSPLSTFRASWRTQQRSTAAPLYMSSVVQMRLDGRGPALAAGHPAPLQAEGYGFESRWLHPLSHPCWPAVETGPSVRRGSAVAGKCLRMRLSYTEPKPVALTNLVASTTSAMHRN
jgi:hypothetical protein